MFRVVRYCIRFIGVEFWVWLVRLLEYFVWVMWYIFNDSYMVDILVSSLIRINIDVYKVFCDGLFEVRVKINFGEVVVVNMDMFNIVKISW